MSENKLIIRNGKTEITIDSPSLIYTVKSGEKLWKTTCSPYILTKENEIIPFTEAKTIRHERYDSGVGCGIISYYGGFENASISFETLVWIEFSTGDVRFEIMPQYDEFVFRKICYPAPFEFTAKSDDAYTVMPVGQGIIIPNTWKTDVKKLPFDGQMCSSGAYMPWFGQVDSDRHGYIAICEHPWDAGYSVDHKAEEQFTTVGMYYIPSLGKLSYRRTVKYTFAHDCDYNTLCKIYRSYVKETGLFTTLEEKAARNPLVNKLIGSAIVHKGTKKHISPDSIFYDKEHPENNDLVIPFSNRVTEIKRYHSKGVRKLYLHLDGWGQPGYDNKHPDYLPACEEAGGWEGFRELSDTIRDCGFMFGLHDQYRDYYYDAATFNKEFAAQAPDGKIHDASLWAGGHQTYLCASQAPYYVKRNFEEVLAHGIHLEATYLDVFTCNEGDECSNPHHRMTRKECFEYRASCFSYLWSKNILPSSEECSDWAMNQLVFCHYGPYEFMLASPTRPRIGVAVPLFNLVYHDCMILPWPMDRFPDKEDYMLYALLNGGAAYLDKDGAYPNTDGAFDAAMEKKLDEEIGRYKVVAALQEKVAKCEMLKHEFVDGDYNRQRTTFSDGTSVTVNLGTGDYEIKYN